MERFYIVTNDGKDRDGRVTEKIRRTLEGAGKTCLFSKRDDRKNIIRESVPEDADCAIVIGGDGTLIEVARILKSEIPILGINMGTLGYLTEVDPPRLEEALAQILQGDYCIEDRMMLEGHF